jgi:LacI family transcriptional regulator
LKAAADLGYKLQIRMPTTVAARINTIGVAVKRDPGQHPRIDPFNYAILCGIEDECARLGLNLMYASIPVDEASSATAWSPLLENDDVDAVAIVGVVFNDLHITDRIPRHLPVVLVDAFAKSSEFDTVISNNISGAYHAVRHLIEQGHRHIGLVGSSTVSPEHPGISQRREGYLKALADHGIHETYIENSSLHWRSANDAARRLLQREPQLTAVVGCSDDVAVQIIDVCNQLGLRVPEDISVIGFDDVANAQTTTPPLTTMRIDKELMGALAVRQLYDHSSNLDRPPITTLLGTRLIERGSVAPCVGSTTNGSNGSTSRQEQHA